MKQELSVAEGLIFREHRIVLPHSRGNSTPEESGANAKRKILVPTDEQHDPHTRRVTDGRAVCRDASQFKLANAVTNITDEPEKNEEAQTPHSVPDLKIPEKETPPSVPPDTTANAETPPKSPSVETIPEPEPEQKQGAEQDQPVTKPALTRPRRKRRQPSHLMDYVLT
ncbi:hypothetical protein ACROYT_G018725 [Oculina patagonica]